MESVLIMGKFGNLSKILVCGNTGFGKVIDAETMQEIEQLRKEYNAKLLEIEKNIDEANTILNKIRELSVT